MIKEVATTLKLDNYRAVIRKLKNRYRDLYDLRLAMDVLVDVAVEDFQNGFLPKDDYYRICIDAANISYPNDDTEE